MYLTHLADDEIDIAETRSLGEYSTFLASYVNTIDRLVEVIRALKCKLKTENLEDFFEPLRPYIETYKPKQTTILKTSHAFCDCCELYVPSHLCVWVKYNPELFETEIAFFYRLMRYFGRLIKCDTTPYPVDELYVGEDTPLSGQTNREKLKLLASIVKHYKYICTNLQDP